MRRSLRYISLLLILASICRASESETIGVCFNYRMPDKSCHNVFTEYDLPIFDGQEDFSIESDRIAAFATGWRQWRGYPTLNEDDVLCYLSKTLYSTFPYVFFCYNDRDSNFEINGSIVYRDHKPYGLSIIDSDLKKEIVNIELKSLSYLFIQKELDADYADWIIRSCPNVKYICVVYNPDSLYNRLIRELPIEYYHIMPMVEPYIAGKVHNNIPTYMRLMNRVDGAWHEEYLPENSTMKYLKYICVCHLPDNCIISCDKYPSLKGVSWYGYFKGAGEFITQSTIARLRILNIYESISKDKRIIHEDILHAENIEFLNIRDYRIPDGRKILAKNLRMLITDCNSDILQHVINTNSIEMLSIGSLKSFEHVTALPKLKVLEVDEIDCEDKPYCSLSLAELTVHYMIPTDSQLRCLLESVAEGHVYIKSIRLKGKRDWKYLMQTDFKGCLYVYNMLVEEVSVEMIECMEKIYQSSKSIHVITRDEYPQEAIVRISTIRSVKLFINKQYIIAPQRKVVYNIKNDVALYYIIFRFTWSNDIYNYRLDAPCVDRDWFADSILSCYVVESEQR